MTQHTDDPGKSRLPRVHGTLIFEARWAGTLEQKATTLSFAAMFWAVWVAMWLPVITLAMWLVGPMWGATQFQYNVDDNVLTLALIGMTGVLLGAMLSLWGTVQWLRGLDKKQAPARPCATFDQLCDFHKVPTQDLGAAWRSRRLVIHHDADGQVTAIEASMPLEFSAPDGTASQHSRCTEEPAPATKSAPPFSADVPPVQPSANAEVWQESQQGIEAPTGTDGAAGVALLSAEVIPLFAPSRDKKD